MGFNKIAAHYELMKLADAFQTIMKKEAEGEQQVELKIGVSPAMGEFLTNIVKQTQQQVQSRYDKTYLPPKGDAKYTLKPEFVQQYQAAGAPIPPGPTADPSYVMSIRISSGSTIWTQSGTVMPGRSTIVIDLKPRVKNQQLFIQNVDLNKLRSLVANEAGQKLGTQVPPQIVEIRVNGQPVVKSGQATA
jgi:hypothetical protein